MKFKKRLLPLLIIVLGLVFLVRNFWPVPVRPITAEQRVTHMVMFQNKYGRNIGLCTATAVGPHAILTAEHCNDRDQQNPRVIIDYSTRVYHIVAGIVDDHDHVIFVIDGPAFTNYLPVEKLLNSAPPRQGEQLHIYGDGGGIYPARRLDGVVDTKIQDGDPSEVNKAQGMFYLTISAIPGDSGSAVFGEDGRVVGLTTFRLTTDDDKEEMAGFSLNFTEKMLRFVATLNPPELGGPAQP